MQIIERKDFYKYLFLAVAVWNWVVSLLFMFAYETVAVNFGMVVPNHPIWIELFLALVFLFGIGYFLVSRDISKNHGFVLIGLMSKILVFSVFLYFFILGELHIILLGMGTVDFVSACIMIEFLLYFRKNE